MNWTREKKSVESLGRKFFSGKLSLMGFEKWEVENKMGLLLGSGVGLWKKCAKVHETQVC